MRRIYIKHGRVRGARVNKNTKGAGIKTACSCGGAQTTNLEKLREKLSNITIQKPKERKRYLNFDL
jgi:hypothetical protein